MPCKECGTIKCFGDICASCARLQRKAESDALKVKKVYTIPKKSPKRKEDDKTYSVLRKVFLESKPRCEACLSGICLVQSTDIHHKKGRLEHLLNVKTWLAVCRPCHDYIELNPLWAKSKGFSESRLSKK